MATGAAIIAAAAMVVAAATEVIAMATATSLRDKGIRVGDMVAVVAAMATLVVATVAAAAAVVWVVHHLSETTRTLCLLGASVRSARWT